MQKTKMKHETLMVLSKGYLDVTTELISKVNDGTVSAKDVNEYADKYFDSALKFLSDKPSEEKS